MHRPFRTVIRLVAGALAVLTPVTGGLAAAPAGVQVDPFRPGGQAKDAALTARRLVSVRVGTDTTHVQPGGTFHVVVVCDITPRWHMYWKNAGDSGAPTEISVRGPKGYTIGAALYPRPRAFRHPEGTTYGYEEQVVFFVPVTAPARVEGETINPPVDEPTVGFEVDVFFLVCRERCLIGNEQHTLRIPVEAPRSRDDITAPDVPITDRALLKKFRGRVPAPLAGLPGAEARLDGDRLLVSGPAQGHGAVSFFPVEVPGVTYGEPRLSVEDDRYLVEVPVRIKPQNALGKPMSVQGVVALGQAPDDPAYDFKLELKP